jgi:hypothetical protein
MSMYVSGLLMGRATANRQAMPLGLLRRVRTVQSQRPILKKYNRGPRSAILNNHVSQKWQQLTESTAGKYT